MSRRDISLAEMPRPDDYPGDFYGENTTGKPPDPTDPIGHSHQQCGTCVFWMGWGIHGSCTCPCLRRFEPFYEQWTPINNIALRKEFGMRLRWFPFDRWCNCRCPDDPEKVLRRIAMRALADEN